MESKRSLGVKSLRAAGRKPVKNEVLNLVHEVLHNRMTFLGVNEIPPRNFIKSRLLWRRFNQSGSVSNQAFTLADGHSQFLVVTSTLGAAVPWVDSWRIKKILVYVVGQGNFQSSVTITPTGGGNNNGGGDPEAAYVVSARSPSVISCMQIIPSETKPLGRWYFTDNNGFANTLFQMNVGIGGGTSNNVSTLEIEFEIRQNELGLPLGYGTTTATTVLGTQGGRSIAGGNYTLIGINNLG